MLKSFLNNFILNINNAWEINIPSRGKLHSMGKSIRFLIFTFILLRNHSGLELSFADMSWVLLTGLLEPSADLISSFMQRVWLHTQ